MKKSYVKPQVYFENFQLSASIAGTCDPKYKFNYSDINSCYTTVVGTEGTYFAGEACTVKSDPEGFCYQGHASMFFAS